MHGPPDGGFLSIWDSFCGWTGQQANLVFLDGASSAYFTVVFVLISNIL